MNSVVIAKTNNATVDNIELPHISEYVENHVCSVRVKTAYVLDMVKRGLFVTTWAEAKAWGDKAYLQINRDTSPYAMSGYRRVLLEKTAAKESSDMASQVVFYIPYPGYEDVVAKKMGIA